MNIVPKDICRDTRKATGLEWLDTNGAGGYASSSIAGCNTRKYHGLLVADLEEPEGKYVLLSGLEEALLGPEEELYFSVHRFAGADLPRRHHLVKYECSTHPKFRYAFGIAGYRKEILMLQQENTVLVRYTCISGRRPYTLRIRPFLAYRHFHQLTSENDALNQAIFPLDACGFYLNPYEGMPPLTFRSSEPMELLQSPLWYHRFQYDREEGRGFDSVEDLFAPCTMSFEMGRGDQLTLCISDTLAQESPDLLWQYELKRRQRRNRALVPTGWRRSLAISARQFLSVRAGTPSIIAGYPWFREWGRDAMISLPGMLVADGDLARYREVLEGFALQQRSGIVPNYLGSRPTRNAYNSVDAGLWLVWAVQQYLLAEGSTTELSGVIGPALEEIFLSYKEGTEHGIAMLPDGLLTAGTGEEQLTWMDAMVDGRPVTPRSGAAVEINALWYNLIAFLAEGHSFIRTEVTATAADLLDTVRQSFNDRFWLEDRGYLADVVNGDEQDTSLRPNQIFAVSLPHSPLNADRARQVVTVVRQHLLTPVGLRTLDPDDAAYCPRYEGGPQERDTAYHNGTVWPWLLGHYGDALLRVAGQDEEALGELQKIIEGLEEQTSQHGLGTISEIFDGSPPHRAHGCISQAWSVAEILRLGCTLEKHQNEAAMT